MESVLSLHRVDLGIKLRSSALAAAILLALLGKYFNSIHIRQILYLINKYKMSWDTVYNKMLVWVLKRRQVVGSARAESQLCPQHHVRWVTARFRGSAVLFWLL